MKITLPPGWPRLLFWALAVAALASVGLQAMPVLGHFSQRDQIWQAVAGAARPAALAVERVSLQGVLDLAPFGRPTADAAPPAETGGDQTSFVPGSLTLLGVVVATPASGSMAIIAVDGAAPARFAIGDMVQGGKRLQTVAADHVTLSGSGAPQDLGFPEAERSAVVDLEAADPGQGNFLKTLIPVASISGTDDDTTAPITRTESLADAREALLRNPDGLLQRYGIEDTAQGYLITDATPPALLQIGLRPGDLVTGLNGEALAGLASDSPLLDRVASSPVARLAVNRDGATLNLTVPLQ